MRCVREHQIQNYLHLPVLRSRLEYFLQAKIYMQIVHTDTNIEAAARHPGDEQAHISADGQNYGRAELLQSQGYYYHNNKCCYCTVPLRNTVAIFAPAEEQFFYFPCLR
jgi:hypothetical protein